MSFVEQLNDEQRRACISTEGPLLVLAGAGSGKTRTLTYRIAHLVEDRGVSPSTILAFTFTNKAAKEMKTRIEQLVGPGAQTMWVGTFHAIAVRVLRQDIHQLGYDPRFLVYDTDDSKALIREIIKDLGYDDKRWPVSLFVQAISRAKNSYVGVDQWNDDSFTGQKIEPVYRRYQARLKALNAVDFDDLIYLTVDLLQNHPDVLARYHERFRYLLVDEYQDTNLLQYQLISLLAKGHNNLCAVGDDDQSIYGWRGADMRNILEFQRDFPNAQVIRLEENYRSTQTILDAANAVVRNNQGRLGKELWTQKGHGKKILVNRSTDESSEAWFSAEVIHEAVRRGLSLSDCAILYRTNAQSRAFELSLSRAGIAYHLVGGHKFYDRKEVKDVLAYLRVLFNPQDEISLMRIVNYPKRGIGDVAVSKLRAAADATGKTLYETMGHADLVEGLSGQAQRSSLELFRLFENWASQTDLPLAEKVRQIAEHSGILPMFRTEKTRESEDRMENIGELISEAKRFEEEQSTSDLGEFLGWVALVSDWDKTTPEEGGVWLMTLHSAKGLEFPLVILGGLEEGVFPHSRSIEEGQIEEERRLMYVGLTRAREELYLSYAETRTMLGRTTANLVSRFMKEIPEELVELPKRPKTQERSSYRGASGGARNTMDIPPLADLDMGERVKHPRFGWGTIVALRGSGDEAEVTLAFPGGGVRSFLAKFAQLSREEA